MERARRYLDWVTARAQPSGVLPEQVHPDDGTAWSVTPLTWSHAEFIWTVGRFVERLAALQGQQAQAVPAPQVEQASLDS